VERPLDDWANQKNFQPPPVPPAPGPAFEEEQARARAHMERYYLKSGWISLFEVMHAVRRFEDVLMDLTEDTPQIHELADVIQDYQSRNIAWLLARGADAIQFGDDFGTSTGLMLSPAVWRRFFKPRFETLIKQVKTSGKAVFFHTCGCNSRILEDLAELGINVIWPQLPSYRAGEMAEYCRRHRIAIEIHPDRGDLMQHASPEAVRAEVRRLADEFRVAEGGGWFYVEIDAGFPLANVEALIAEIGALRGY
jgi:uroporphyrinogen-III decarboxylase